MVDPAQRGRIEAALDKLENRLLSGPPGLHTFGAPATPAALAASGLPEDAALLWERWDGMSLAYGDFELLTLAALSEAATVPDTDLAPGDLVVARRGRDVYVLPNDPWEEGASVVLVEETGERMPESSSVAHLVLATVGELGVLYGADGEFRDELFDEDTGELLDRVERKILRKRLDVDPDAPHARYRLACLLRRSGEATAARRELEGVLKRAPELAWAHYELGRAHHDAGDAVAGVREVLAAAERATDPTLAAHFLAWAAKMSPQADRAGLAARAQQADPDFVGVRVAGIRELLAVEDTQAADELLSLALAVAPSNLELLALREPLSRAQAASDPASDPAPASDQDPSP